MKPSPRVPFPKIPFGNGTKAVLWLAITFGLLGFVYPLGRHDFIGLLYKNFLFLCLSVILYCVHLSMRKRELRRWKPGSCFNCGYDLDGLDGAVCPECGHAPENTP